jgi:DNA-binding transcriptional LysR family regulator
MPDTWARRWQERRAGRRLELMPVEDADQTAVLHEGRADMALVRLPVATDALHVIPLYRDVPVVVVPRDHLLEAADEVTVEDLNEDVVHTVPPLTVREAVETVASGVGVVVLPLSLARLHRRKDVVHRRVVDLPDSEVGLAWLRAADDPDLETFIGVVRGRTVNSSRGGTGEGSPDRTTDRGATKSSGRPGPPRKQRPRPAPGRKRTRRGSRNG